jgi:hypothetical protein
MPKISVALKGFSKAWDAAFGDKRRAMEEGLVSGVMRGQVIVMDNSPVDTGLYQASWDTRLVGPGEAHLGNTAPHAPIIEYGARPHTPPLGPLLAWAKRVLQDPSQPPKYSSAVWKLAKGTQNKIRKHGQKPQHVLTNAIPQIEKLIKIEIKRRIG